MIVLIPEFRPKNGHFLYKKKLLRNNNLKKSMVRMSKYNIFFIFLISSAICQNFEIERSESGIGIGYQIWFTWPSDPDVNPPGRLNAMLG